MSGFADWFVKDLKYFNNTTIMNEDLTPEEISRIKKELDKKY